MKYLLVIVCLLQHAGSVAQVLSPVGKDPGLGIYSRHFQQVFAVEEHPAALAQTTALTAGVYAERRFMLKATSLYAAAIALPTGPGAFSVNMQRFGFTDYQEQKLGFGYGRHLGKLVDIGLQADYFSKSIPGYGQAGLTTFNGGVLVHISPHVHAGADVFNPVRRKLDKLGEEKMPAAYTVGAGYESTQFYIGAAVVSQSDQHLLTKVSCEYLPVKQLALQAGIATNPQYNFAGVSLRWPHLRIDFAGSYHPQLGITPGVAIIWKAHERDGAP